MFGEVSVPSYHWLTMSTTTRETTPNNSVQFNVLMLSRFILILFSVINPSQHRSSDHLVLSLMNRMTLPDLVILNYHYHEHTNGIHICACRRQMSLIFYAVIVVFCFLLPVCLGVNNSLVISCCCYQLQ